MHKKVWCDQRELSYIFGSVGSKLGWSGGACYAEATAEGEEWARALPVPEKLALKESQLSIYKQRVRTV